MLLSSLLRFMMHVHTQKIYGQPKNCIMIIAFKYRKANIDISLMSIPIVSVANLDTFVSNKMTRDDVQQNKNKMHFLILV